MCLYLKLHSYFHCPGPLVFVVTHPMIQILVKSDQQIVNTQIFLIYINFSENTFEDYFKYFTCNRITFAQFLFYYYLYVVELLR